jgi:gamma-glutamyltranspeptidase/glutathione hydrolase
MKLAFADAHRYIADPRSMDIDVKSLLEPAYLESRAKLIDPSKAQDFKHGEPKPGGTILLCAADAQGNMVSLIQSNYQGFGSGVVIPGTGIAMQNRGACFVTEKGHPNQVGGGKRPYHTIIPAFVTRDGKPLMAYGVMGGFMQPQGHMQVLVRMADFGQNPQAALDAPRWQVMTGMKVSMEPGFEADVYEELRRRGHDVDVAQARTVSFGRGQAIYRLEGGAYCGASDLRADGQAVGW